MRSENSKENKQDEVATQDHKTVTGWSQLPEQRFRLPKRLPTYLPLSRAPVSRPAGTGGLWKSREICSVEETYFYGGMGFEAAGHLSDSVALRRSYLSVDFWTHKTGQVTAWVCLI